MTLIFRNWTTFWDILKWNRGQIKWDGGSNFQRTLINGMTINVFKPLDPIKVNGLEKV